MKRLAWILPAVLFGSLWGIVEILPVPVPVMMAAGVLFLTLGRRMINRPGASAATGVVVCLLKTYAVNFHTCNVAGIMAVAVSFDVLSSVLWRDDVRTLPAAALRGVFSAVLALPLFVGTMLLVRHPYWVAGGWERIMDYAVRDIAPALLLCLIVAPLGVLVARYLANWRIPRYAIPVLYGSTVVSAWLVATLRFVERVL